jgi:hypothetical protein
MSEVRKQILDAVKHLAEYELDVWKQVGPGVQATLVDYLAELSDKELADIRPLAITIWREALDGELRGTTWRADSVTLHMGAVPVSNALIEIRAKAMKGLFGFFLHAKDDAERREVASALDAATRTPTHAQYSNELLSLTLKNAKEIVDFYAAHKKLLSFELAQHLEHQFLYDYQRAEQLIEDKDGRFNVQEQAAALRQSIVSFSQIVNENPEFIRYKVLVGFESVYPGHWLDHDYDFKDAEEYRKAQADEYIQEISPENQAGWFTFVERCASTKSNDLATFPVFGQFLVDFAAAKPAVASEWLQRASPDLLSFLPAFLRGLARSDRRDLYLAAVEQQLTRGTNLSGLARHLRNDENSLPDLPGRVLEAAIERGDDAAVVETFVLILEQWNSNRVREESVLFDSALMYLTARHITAWVSNAWFQPRASTFLASIGRDRTKRVLDNLLDMPKVDYRLERILEQLPIENIDLVWDYFSSRLAREKPDYGSRYEAIPYDFHGLEKKLSENPALALKKVRDWYTKDRKLFRFTGGRLLSIAFPGCPEPFGEALANLAASGTETDADFVLDVVQNYYGEPTTHEALKQIVTRYPGDAGKLSKVKVSFDHTGVVSGEYGMVEAYREKRALMQTWLNDSRPEIRAFADQHIKELNQQIVHEQKRAEEHSALRGLDYPQDDRQQA